MKILLLSRYGSLGASSRLRLFQYLPFLKSKGWQVDVSPLFSDDYVQALYSGQTRKKQVVAGYWHRIKMLLQLRGYDLVWVEKEFFPFLPAFTERLLKAINLPYVVDYDDAWFHRYDLHDSWLIRTFLGQKIDTVMNRAALVIAGNEYLADRALRAGARRVEVVPTVVNRSRYKVKLLNKNHRLVVGWVGSPLTSHYLLDIASVFEELKKDFDVHFVAIGADSAMLKELPINVKTWSESTEAESILSFDIGIMPLEDSSWERGKCGYKLIQYMACGLPVVASPVGVNSKIIQHGVNGFLAKTLEEWSSQLQCLLNNSDLRNQMGGEGRKRVERWYSTQVQGPRLVSLLQSVVKE